MPSQRLESRLGKQLLTSALETFYQLEPHQLILKRTANGKPFLKYHPDIACSITHSHGRVASVQGPVAALGIDMEYMQRSNNVDAVAKRYFHPQEVAALQDNTLSTAQRKLHFFCLWTLKEATIKALGKTVNSATLCNIAFSLNGSQINPLFTLPANRRWSFLTLQLDDDYVVSLVTAQRCYLPRSLATRQFFTEDCRRFGARPLQALFYGSQ